MKVTEEFLNVSEDLVRNGRSAEVRGNLLKVRLKSVPRQYCARLANLANRAGFQTFGVKLLNPIVRENLQATPLEKMEYANLLMAIGAQSEAFDLLSEIDHQKYPKALLYKAFILISEWDYKNAIPMLEEYIGREEVTQYQANIAKVNLASAYSAISENKRAIGLLDEIIKFAEEQDYKLLLSNVYGVYGSAKALEGDLMDGIRYIKKGIDSFDGVHITYKLLVERWSAYAEYQVSQSEAAMTELKRVRDKALNIQLWETARDTDYLIALVTNDTELAQKIYAGTPYSAYRSRLTDAFSLSMGDHYVVRADADACEDRPLLDLESGFISGVPLGSKAFVALFRAMFMDSYKELSLGNIHTLVFPDEFYNPETTPNKIYQLLHRAKKWGQKNDLNFDVSKENNFYKIVLGEPYDIKMPLDLSAASLGVSRDHYNKLVDLFGRDEFSAAAAADALDKSPRHVLNILNDLKDNGKLESIGVHNQTKYRLLSEVGGVA